MKLCFGSYATVLKLCAHDAVTNRILISKLVGLVDKDAALDEDGLDWLFTKLMGCKADFNRSRSAGKDRETGTSRTSVMTLVHKVKTEDIVSEFEDEIIPLLIEDKKHDVVLYLKNILLSDNSSTNEHGRTFLKFMGVDASYASLMSDIYLPHFLAGLFLYSVAIGGNKSDEGAATVAEIKKEDYLERQPRFIDDFKLVETPIKKKAPESSTIRTEISQEQLSYYFGELKNKFSKVKTLLDNDAPRPIYEFYVPNRIYYFSAVPGQKRMEYHEINIDKKSLSAFLATTNYMILSGTGGLGKSMMMRHILMRSIDEYDQTGILPVFLLLKDFEQSDVDLVSFIHRRAAIFWPGLSRDMIVDLLREGRLLLLLDGLDEIHSDYARRFEGALEELVDRYPKNHYLLSSRPYNFRPFTRFTVFHLQAFSKDQAIQMIKRLDFHPDEPEIKEKFLKDLNRSLFKEHEDFASIPLLLTLMLMTYAEYANIPANLHEFYAQAFTTLAQKHDATKSSYHRIYHTGLTTEQFSDSFSEFCYLTYCSQKFELSSIELSQFYQRMNFFQDLRGYKGTMDDYIYDLMVNLCLMYEENGKYSFTHRSFQEYFCALFFSRLPDDALKQVGTFFERHSIRTGADQTFEMLYRMIRHRVEKTILLPRLDKLFDDCDKYEDEYRKELDDEWDEGLPSGIPAYWNFLMTMYPNFEVGDGDVYTDYDPKPDSFLYNFLAREYGAMHGQMHASDFYDDLDRFLCETYVHVPRGPMEDEVVPIDEAPKPNYDGDEEDYYEKAGNRYEVDWYELWSDIDPDDFLIERINDDDFPLRKEYLAMRKVYEEMKERCERNEQRIFSVIL